MLTCSTPQELFELTGLGVGRIIRRELKKKKYCKIPHVVSQYFFFCCNATVLRKLPESLLCAVDLSSGFPAGKN